MEILKRCTICKIEKTASEYYRHVKKWMNKNGGKSARYLDPYCKSCLCTKLSEWRKNNPNKLRESYIRSRKKLRNEFIEAYGGKCICCGEVEPRFLTLEHMNGGGLKHSLMVGRGAGVIRDLKRRGWPKDKFTLLCFNCNLATAHGGTCPHGNYTRKKQLVSI